MLIAVTASDGDELAGAASEWIALFDEDVA
jgi:hypothetical protein